MAVSTTEQARTKRFNLRATSKQERLIRVAAKKQGVSVTDFILEGACEKAEQTLSDQSRFVVDARTWERFMKALDGPPKAISQIKRLFSEPSIAESR